MTHLQRHLLTSWSRSVSIIGSILSRYDGGLGRSSLNAILVPTKMASGDLSHHAPLNSSTLSSMPDPSIEGTDLEGAIISVAAR